MGRGDLPLQGKRIVVTRPRAQAGSFVESLEELGAEVLAVPMIRIVEPLDSEPLRTAVRQARRFDWIVFTSANGVVRFWEELREAGLDNRALTGVSLCAIGPATASALEAKGARADLIPDEHVTESVVEALSNRGALGGARVLFPRAELARDVLPVELRKLGAEVMDVTAYRTVPDDTAAGVLRDRLARAAIDVVTFTSSSTVRSFANLVTEKLHDVIVATIGPITSATVRELGWDVTIEAPVHTTEGLRRAIVDYYAPPVEAASE